MSRPDEEALAELRPSAHEEASDWELDAGESDGPTGDDEVVS